VVVWNTLAYVQTFAGNLEAGKQSIADYRKLQPKDANALDSLAELHYYEGRFAEAEKHFLESYELNNLMLGGGSLYRAALSRFLAGDRAKADAHFKRYAEFREKHKDALLPLREAIWLYTTGRKQEARQKAAQIATPQAKTQVLLWDMAEGKGNPALLGERPELQGWRMLFDRRYPEAIDFWSKIYNSTSVVNGNEARMVLAWALTNANRAPEAAALMQKWPLPPPGPEPGLSSIAVAKFIELKAGGR
jgi:tetratricopeptide (TPR) repeat protein